MTSPRMHRRRYLAAGEAQEGTKLDAAAVKALTGGEKIAVRFMRSEFFEFKMVGTIQLTANHLQHLPNDPAMYRRLNLCRWDVVIPKSEQNPDLTDDIFEAESADLLNWVLQGWRSGAGRASIRRRRSSAGPGTKSRTRTS